MNKILIKNELYKLVKKKKVYIMSIIIIFFSISQVFLSQKYDRSKNINWKESAEAQIEYVNEVMHIEAERIGQEEIKVLKEQKAYAEYVLEHNIASFYITTYGQAITNALAVIAICVLLSVIIVSDVFCEDFSLKTIKTLFTRPNKRESILLAKILTSLIIFLAFSLLAITISCFFTAFFYDISGKNQVILYMNKNQEIIEKSYLLYFFQQYLCALAEGISYVLMGIMCAIISKSAAITSVISVMGIMGANTFVLFFEEKTKLIKYLLFYNTDLSQYLNNGSNYWGTSFGFSVAIILVYCSLFMIISNYFYCKKDIF